MARAKLCRSEGFYLSPAPLRLCSGSLEHTDPPASPELAMAGRVRREQCTSWKDDCDLKPHARQDVLDTMLSHDQSREAKRDIETRQHFLERFFGEFTRYGYKEAQWRRQWRIEIRDFLLAAI